MRDAVEVARVAQVHEAQQPDAREGLELGARLSDGGPLELGVRVDLAADLGAKERFNVAST